MDICISNIKHWYPNHLHVSIEQLIENIGDVELWPKVDFVPVMQRRRLSPFAKMALFTAHQALNGLEEELPIIFSSRHGDLHKTSELLADLADEVELSPTAFSLSVHNAIPSLYSILTKNKQAVNAIAAGKDSFFMALVDAYARLSSGICDKVLIIHCDQKLPETYVGFKDELQISHAVSLLVSLPVNAGKVTLNNFEKQISISYVATESHDIDHMPSALSFLRWYHEDIDEFIFQSNTYQWKMNKNGSKD